MNLKTASLVAAIGSAIRAVSDIRWLISYYKYIDSVLNWVFQLGSIAFPVCLAIFFFTLWRKQK